ncbi:MAG: DUF4089 domain-containing protein [Pseudolabrys sp.]
MADPLDDMIAGAARTLEIPVDPAWTASIKTNLKATLDHARAVEQFPLPDEAEPAPLFKA